MFIFHDLINFVRGQKPVEKDEGGVKKKVKEPLLKKTPLPSSGTSTLIPEDNVSPSTTSEGPYHADDIGGSPIPGDSNMIVPSPRERNISQTDKRNAKFRFMSRSVLIQELESYATSNIKYWKVLVLPSNLQKIILDIILEYINPIIKDDYSFCKEDLDEEEFGPDSIVKTKVFSGEDIITFLPHEQRFFRDGYERLLLFESKAIISIASKIETRRALLFVKEKEFILTYSEQQAWSMVSSDDNQSEDMSDIEPRANCWTYSIPFDVFMQYFCEPSRDKFLHLVGDHLGQIAQQLKDNVATSVDYNDHRLFAASTPFEISEEALRNSILSISRKSNLSPSLPF